MFMKIQNDFNHIIRAKEKADHEKNREKKISYQCIFNLSLKVPSYQLRVGLKCYVRICQWVLCVLNIFYLVLNFILQFKVCHFTQKKFCYNLLGFLQFEVFLN